MRRSPPRRLIFRDFLHIDQMGHLVHHPTDGGRISHGYTVMQSAESQCLDHSSLVLGFADVALFPGYFQLGHKIAPVNCRASRLPGCPAAEPSRPVGPASAAKPPGLPGPC